MKRRLFLTQAAGTGIGSLWSLQNAHVPDHEETASRNRGLQPEGTIGIWSASKQHPPRIQYDPNSPEPVHYAAGQLRTYLEMILGVGLPATDRANGSRIVLDWIIDLELGDEGFEILADGNTVRIRGDALGLVYGVFEFLRAYGGCQFSGLGPDGEFVPRRQRIDIRASQLRRMPHLWYRGLQFSFPEPSDLTIQRLDWMVKNGLNYVTAQMVPDDVITGWRLDLNVAPAALAHKTASAQGNETWFRRHIEPEIVKRGLKIDFNHHNLLAYWLPPDRYFSQHPEWYAEVSGKRGARALQLAICTSNDQAVSVLIDNVLRYIRANPKVTIVGVVPEDGFAMCECRECVRRDPDPTDVFRTTTWENYRTPGAENRSKIRRYWLLVNRVARAVRHEFPEVLIGTGAYADMVWPPRDVRPERNVVTWVAVHWRDGAHPLAEDSTSLVNRFYFDVLKQWKQIHPGRVILYEYYMGMTPQRSLPYPMAEVISREWSALKTLGVEGATIQSWSSNHNSYGMNNLAFARSGWSSFVDYQQLLSDYLVGMFGSVADEIRPIFENLGRAVRRVELGSMQSSMYLSRWHGLAGGPNALSAGQGSFLPDGYNIGYLLQQVGSDVLEEQLARAAKKASNERERRQIETLLGVSRYWQIAAETSTFELQAIEAEGQGDVPKAQALYAEAEGHAQAAKQYLSTLPVRGWIDVRTVPGWQTLADRLAKRRQTLTRTQ